MEDNTIIILQKAIKRFNIKVTNSTIKEFLLSHPHYPSLKCVCDALKKWNIEHFPLKLDLNEIKDLDMPFIAHLNSSGGQLAFVEKADSHNVIYSQNGHESLDESFETFSKKASGAIIVLNGDKTVREEGYRQSKQNELFHKALLPSCILTILLFTLYNFLSGTVFKTTPNYVFWGLIATKVTGITASFYLILGELKIHNPISDKLCGFSSKTDCKEVLSSNASQLFGPVNWADVGMVYFVGTLIYFLGTDGLSSLGILSIISIVSLPYPVFSVYFQAIKLKKWCPFCLFVQLVLICEFSLLIIALSSITINWIDVIKFSSSLAIPTVLWITNKTYLEKQNKFEKEHFSFLKLKHNPDIFTFLFRKNGFEEFTETTNSLLLGAPTAPITITAFLSLYCKPCTKTFQKLKLLIESCAEVKINIIFSVYNDTETQKIINTIYYINSTDGDKKALDFISNWYTTPIHLRKKLYGEIVVSNKHQIAQIIGAENNNLFEKHHITGTPTVFVNGYKFPLIYSYSDIEYYVDEIKMLTRKNLPVN